jgi:hypothetical protein
MADQTTIAANTELVREFIRRVFNEHNAQATSEYFSPDVFGDEAGADATRGIDEALQTISELELRRRFRVDPAQGPRSTSRRKVSTSTGTWPSCCTT